MAANVNPRTPRSTSRSTRSPRAATATSALALAIPGQELVGPELAKPIRTRATYRQLMMRGLDSPSAANLTAFMAGLAVSEKPWSLPEVNRILFLRDMAQRGRWISSGIDGTGPAIA